MCLSGAPRPSTRYARAMRRLIPLLALLATGCRGPSPLSIAGTGLKGAIFFAVSTWILLTGVARLRQHLAQVDWDPQDARRGWPVLVGVHAALTAAGVALAAGVNDGGLTGLIWGCAAANHLAWAILIWRVSGVAVPWAAVWAAIPSLLPALLSQLDMRSMSDVAILQWLWGGFLGAVPAVLALLVWLEGWIRGRNAPDPPPPRH